MLGDDTPPLQEAQFGEKVHSDLVGLFLGSLNYVGGAHEDSPPNVVRIGV
jgi:hypothetical protein